MAQFDESKVISPLHTEKAEVGKKYWVSDELVDLKEVVEKEQMCFELKDIREGYLYPFMGVFINSMSETEFQFLYPYEEPPKKRMSKIQLIEWLCKGNGVYKDCDNYVLSHYTTVIDFLDEEVDKTFLIRPFGQTEWQEPTVDIYERDCKKEN